VRSSNGGNVHLHRRVVCRSQRRDMSPGISYRKRIAIGAALKLGAEPPRDPNDMTPAERFPFRSG
jgi:hypothetical protein